MPNASSLIPFAATRPATTSCVGAENGVLFSARLRNETIMNGGFFPFAGLLLPGTIKYAWILPPRWWVRAEREFALRHDHGHPGHAHRTMRVASRVGHSFEQSGKAAIVVSFGRANPISFWARQGRWDWIPETLLGIASIPGRSASATLPAFGTFPFHAGRQPRGPVACRQC